MPPSTPGRPWLKSGSVRQMTACRLTVRDDGIGGANLERGSGLIGLADRVEALGGTLTIHSGTGQGTRLEVDLPIHSDDSAS